MSLAAIVAAAVVLIAATIAAISVVLSDRRKKNEENRKLAIETYGEARTAWDQAHIEDVTINVRREKLQEVRRCLVKIELLLGDEVRSKEMGQLLTLLNSDLLSPAARVEFALAQVVWPEVEKQLQESLRAKR